MLVITSLCKVNYTIFNYLCSTFSFIPTRSDSVLLIFCFSFLFSNAFAFENNNPDATCSYNNKTETVLLCPIFPATSVTSNYNGQDISCYGASDGAAQVTVAGAIGPITYLWSDASTNATIIGKPAGIYTVTVTQFIPVFCGASATVEITEPDSLYVTGSKVDVCIPGSNTGSIDLTVTGATSPYTYLWTNTATTQDISGLTAGPYGVQVTDANGCTKTRVVNIIEPAQQLGVVVTTVFDENCPGSNDGGVNITPRFGIIPYSYLWSSGQTTEDIPGLSAGTYTVTVTDRIGCTATVSATVITLGGILVTETHVNVSCNGDGDGSIDVTTVTGTPPFIFDWAHIVGPNNPEDVSGLFAGNYTLYTRDASGCRDTLQVIITEPAVLSATESHIDISCFGASDGSIDVTTTGGTMPYTFTWSTGATTEDISALDTGSYSLTVSDFNGCKASVSATIEQPDSLDISESHIDISCNGADDGSIDLKVNGGRLPYTYNWSNGETTEDISSLSPNTYTVTVTDFNLCTSTISVTINEPASLAITGIINDALCTGDSTGSIDITVTGGTSPYTYNWSHLPALSDPEDVSNLWAATYTVTVTDANGCTIVDDFDVDEPGSLVDVKFKNINDVLCHGDSTGDFEVDKGGGTPPYTYLWSNGSTLEDQFNIPVGTYTVTITDANGCTDTLSGTITEPPLMVLTQTHVDILCNGFNTGSIDLTVAGGVSPYDFDWSNGAGTEDITNLLAGTYTVTVEDDNGCIDTTSVTLTEPALITITETHVDLLCNGDGNGSIDITVAGGVSPYTYLWSSGQTTEDISSLSGSTFTVTVTDANACTMTLAIIIIEPGVLSITETHADISCNGANDGSIDASVTGGTLPYTYNWSTGSTNEDISVLSPGTYTLTVTDANACVDTISVTIIDPPVLVVSESHTDVICKDDDDGTIDITATGGTPPINYDWFHIGGPINPEDLTGLSPGTYTVRVYDANGCDDTLAINIVEPAALGITETHIDVLCTGDSTGSIDITVTGGITPYTYNWSNGETTEDINNLPDGLYTITVTDANGCTIDDNIDINQPGAALSVTLDQVIHVLCNGESTGEIKINVGGGTGGRTYLWSDGSTIQDLNNAPVGIYTVTVTDINGCVDNLTDTINEPPAIVFTETHVDILCNGFNTGSIDLTTSGGAPPYIFDWLHIGGGSNPDDLTNMLAGTYTVILRDANNCRDTLVITLTEPPLIVITETHNDVTCNGDLDGSIDISAVGGVPPYSYSWSSGQTTEDISSLSGDTFTVTVTDANSCTMTLAIEVTEPGVVTITDVESDISCFGLNDGSIDVTMLGGRTPFTFNWSSGETTEDLTGLVPGTYTLTATDINGCDDTATYVITEPPLLTISETHVNDSCKDANTGAIDITVGGGVLPYTFDWNHIGGPINPEDVTGLGNGNYDVEVTDANGCTITIAVTITEPAELGANDAITDGLCFGDTTGSIDITPIGGTPPYAYLWSTGATTEDIGPVPVGTYTLTITDALLCTFSDDYIVDEPNLLDVVVDKIEDVDCFGNSTGEFKIKVNGGTNPKTYLWSNGATTEDLISIPTGSYSVTVTDANGCVDTLSGFVPEPPLLVFTETHFGVTCNGDGDGTIDVTAIGGVPPYKYDWLHILGNDNPEDLTNLSPGTYTVILRDNNNCRDTLDITIINPAVLTLSESHSNVLCNGANDGSIDVSVIGGVTPYSYLWNNASTNEDPTGLSPGSYTVTVTDAHGCTETISAEISEPSILSLSESHNNVSCNGGNNGSIDITPSGGIAPYTYIWSSGETTEDISGLIIGAYTVTVTDANSCTATISTTIAQASVITATETHVNLLCNGDSIGSIDLTIGGGTPFSASPTVLLSENFEGVTPTALPAGFTQSTLSTDGGWNSGDSLSLSDMYLVFPGHGQFVGTNDGSCNCDKSADYLELPSQDLSSYISANITAEIYFEGGTYLGVTETAFLVVSTDGGSSWNTEATFSGVIGSWQSISVDLSAYTGVGFTSVDVAFLYNDGGDWLWGMGVDDIQMTASLAPYNYLWSNAETTEDISSLSAGTYTVTVTDGNACTLTASVEITEPPAITISETHVDVLCNGGSTGSIDLTLSGGTPGFVIDWAHIPGPSNPEDVTSLAIGTYYVTVTDANGCTAMDSVTINEPATLIISETHSNISCYGGNDGSIDITPSGGVSPYSYSWSNAATTEDLSGIIAGTYTITVTDANSCTNTLSVAITEPAILTLSETHINVSCNGGGDASIDITPAGGTGPYSFNWSNAETTEDISNLSIGTYTVTVTDINSCTATLSITITEPASMTISETHVDAACNAEASGSINITVGGGTTPYVYTWSNGATTEDVTSLLAGTYTVTVTDNEGCTITTSAIIGEPTAIALTETHVDVSCTGGNDGSIDITSSGGTGMHNYFWSTLSAAEDISGLIAGTYTVTVTDANFCTASFSIVVGEPTPLTVAMSKTNTSCSSNFDGTATATPGGATPPYTYLWSTGATTQTISSLDSNIYTVTVTDSLGCFLSDTIRIPFIPLLSVVANVTSSYSGYDVSCPGASDGFGSSLPVGGTFPYSYSWSNGQTTSLLQNVTSGTYTITITDNRGCTSSSSITLTDPPGLTLDLTISSDFNGQNISCYGNSDGAINSAVSLGSAPYTYSWSTGSTIDSIVGLAAGSYTLTVTDANGCQITKDTLLTQPDTISIALTPTVFHGFNISCAGSNDGIIQTLASGGTPVYSYLWNNGTTIANNSAITAGYYELTVSDVNGCTQNTSIILTEPPAMGFTYTSANPSDCGVNDAVISITAFGGLGSYEYSLGGITYQSLNYFNGISTGSYDVYVRADTGSCVSGPVSVVIGAAEVPIIDNYVIIHPTTGVSTDGGVLLQVSGNGLALEYSIDGVNWQSSNTFNGLSVGPYTVSVRYVTQNCISSLNVTLIAGNGVEGSVDNSQVCSDGQSATQFVSLFYVPMPEDNVLSAFLNIYNPSCGASSFPTAPLFGYNSIGVVEGGTVINYDHWEDGYEPNLQFPVLGTTEIWGDNDPSNGIAPGYAVDFFNAGDIIILSDTVDPTTLATVIDYDAGDKFGSQGDLYYSRMIWPSSTNSFLAGAAEVYPVGKWGTNYTIPVGENTANQNNMFEYTGLMIMASEPNTILSINGIPIDTLNEGQNHYVDGGVNEGTVVSATLPVQVQLLTGDRCSRFESRFYSLTPSNTWTNNYYNPVSTRGGRTASTYLFNPGASNISVTREVPGGGTININVPAGATNFDDTPNSVGTRYYTAGGEPFYAVVTMDKGGTGVDWGYALLPAQDLSAQITLVGFAPGENPIAPSGSTNASPIWITADYPDGSLYDGNPINIYVDYDGDGGALMDPFGTMYDASFTVNSLDQLILYDPDENDQTGMKIWVGDTSDAIIAGAYGQEGGAPGVEAAKLDLGTGLFNKVPFLSRKCVDLYTDYTNNGLFDECDEVIYTIIMANTGSLPLVANSVNIRDTLSSQLTYIPNSTQLITQSGIVTVPDNGGAATPFPLDEMGYGLSNLIQPGDSVRLSFQATINKSLGASFIENVAHIANSNTELSPQVSFPVQNPANVSLPNIQNDTTINCDQIVPDPPYQDTCLSNIYINSNNFSLYSVTSEDTSGVTGDAVHAFDNDPNTYWSSNFTPGPPPGYPHVIQIDLGSIYGSVRGLAYLPRQDTTLTRIGSYEIYLSLDGIAWGAAVTSGTWDTSATVKQISFPDTSARYVRLRAISAADGGLLAGAAEIDVLICGQSVVYTDSTTQTANGTCTDYAYTITREWTVTNHCLNIATQDRVITVQDTTPPQIFTIPLDVSVHPDSIPIVPTLLAIDNCDTNVVLTQLDSAYASGCDTIIKRIWTATDICGNIFSDFQLITVQTCPENCTNGLDDDGDGLIDCDDPDCYLSLNVDAGNDTTICRGNNFTLNAVTSGGTGPFTYSWNNGLGAGQSHVVAPLVNTTYTVTVTDVNGCTNSASIDITVNIMQITNLFFNDLVGSDDTIINNGFTYNTSNLPAFFNIQANKTGPGIGSVKYTVSGPVSGVKIDNFFPFSYPTNFGPFGDSSGTYTVVAEVFAEKNAMGPICQTYTLSFTFNDIEICNDGIDNDGDGDIDCADSQCEPTKPGPISSSDTVECAGNNGIVYSIAVVPGAISYDWTVPAGASIIAGQGTTNISVSWGSTGGNICVRSYNGFCYSDNTCQNITIQSPPASPGPIIH